MARTWRSKLATVAAAALCAWLLLLAVSATLRHAASQRNLDELQWRIDAGERENRRLAADLERMKQPAWLTLLARARLNYKRPDETVVFVYKSEKSGTIGQPQNSADPRPNWRKWWDWLLSRD